jgi:hypothetical protein
MFIVVRAVMENARESVLPRALKRTFNPSYFEEFREHGDDEGQSKIRTERIDRMESGSQP